MERWKCTTREPKHLSASPSRLMVLKSSSLQKAAIQSYTHQILKTKYVVNCNLCARNRALIEEFAYHAHLGCRHDLQRTIAISTIALIALHAIQPHALSTICIAVALRHCIVMCDHCVNQALHHLYTNAHLDTSLDRDRVLQLYHRHEGAIGHVSAATHVEFMDQHLQVRSWHASPAKVESEQPLGPISTCNDSTKQVNWIVCTSLDGGAGEKVWAHVPRGSSA